MFSAVAAEHSMSKALDLVEGLPARTTVFISLTRVYQRRLPVVKPCVGTGVRMDLRACLRGSESGRAAREAGPCVVKG